MTENNRATKNGNQYLILVQILNLCLLLRG